MLFAEIDITAFGTNDKWLPFGMGVHAASGGDPDVGDRILDLSADDPKFADEGAQILARQRWESFCLDKPSLIGVGSLMKICRDHGVQEETLRKVFNTAVADFEGEPIEADDGCTSPGNEVMPIEQRGMKVNPKTSKAEDTYTNAFIAVANPALFRRGTK